MKPVDHALVEQLLADETLSYKEIARRAACSDFSVRTIARKLSGDDRPMKTPRARRYVDQPTGEDAPPLTGTEQAIGWGVAVLFFIGLVALSWYVRRDDFPRYDPPEGPLQ